MSYLDKLLEGVEVEWKPLGELGYFYGGLTGKSKDDFNDGNAKFITYKNIYSNFSLKIDIEDTVKVEENEKQNTIEYGDVLFTGSSETPDECGFSSVLTLKTNEKLYLNSFCFGFRLFDKQLFLPDFLKFLFRSVELRKQIGKTASGVTRFNVSKVKMTRIQIPIPPLPVQTEIVRILDKFSTLTATLTAELQARKSQYEYYRDQLLNYPMEEPDQLSLRSSRSASSIQKDGNPSQSQSAPNPLTSNSVLQQRGKVEWKRLGEIGEIVRGKRVVKNDLSLEGDFPVFQNCLTPLGYRDKANRKAETPFIIVGGAAGNIGYSRCDFWAADDCLTIDLKDCIKNRYAYYFLESKKKYLQSQVRKSSIPRLSKSVIEDMIIPIPPLPVQARIVAILDKFDTLTNSISEGLPKEIELRQKQYEYYRDMLLTFNVGADLRVCPDGSGELGEPQ